MLMLLMRVPKLKILELGLVLLQVLVLVLILSLKLVLLLILRLISTRLLKHYSEHRPFGTWAPGWQMLMFRLCGSRNRLGLPLVGSAHEPQKAKGAYLYTVKMFWLTTSTCL